MITNKSPIAAAVGIRRAKQKKERFTLKPERSCDCNIDIAGLIGECIHANPNVTYDALVPVACLSETLQDIIATHPAVAGALSRTAVTCTLTANH